MVKSGGAVAKDLGSVRATVRLCEAAGLRPSSAVKMRAVLDAMSRGKGAVAAYEEAGVSSATVKGWRERYAPFQVLYEELLGVNREVRQLEVEARRLAKRRARGLVVDEFGDALSVQKAGGRGPVREGDVPVDTGRPVVARPSLGEFRRRVFGQPTEPHQVLAQEALEDPSNLYVFIFGPPGMGKDTVAGQYLLWEVAPRTNKRSAWFMESEKFSVRRLGRLARYLTDPRVYRHKPDRTPNAVQPDLNLIDTWGPYKWERGMVDSEGNPIERPQWTKNEMYFLADVAPEQDPNLWATGLQGATYGSRIDVAVVSDAFTVENQQSPTEMDRQLDFLMGTLDSRLDEDGRLVVIGTLLPVENNYMRLLETYTEDARILEVKHHHTSTLTRYSNGVVVVMIDAYVTDDDGNVVDSYWPERFPLDDCIEMPDGSTHLADGLSVEELDELVAAGGRRKRGLRSRERRNPKMFNAMYRQIFDADDREQVDFPDDVLNSCDDYQRTVGQVFPHETLTLGIDPARWGGAGWVLWAVDNRSQEPVYTVVDVFWGERLGADGIKSKLIVDPAVKYRPSEAVMETNSEGAIAADRTMLQLLDSFGIALLEHKTGRNRNDPEVGVGAMAMFMRSGQVRFPAATPEDRAKMALLKRHLQAWDATPLSKGRPRPGTPNHEPDDLALAAWIGFNRARTRSERRHVMARLPQRAVPRKVRQRYLARRN